MTRTLGRMLVLSAAAAVLLCGRAGAGAPAPVSAGEESSPGRIPEFQRKLNEKIDFELLQEFNLDKILDLLLLKNGIPWAVNEAAFRAANLDPDVIKMTPVEKIEKVTQVTRATILKRLLAKIPNDGRDGAAPTYVLKPDHLEITTVADHPVEITPAGADEKDDPLGDIPAFQKKLSERIDYQLLAAITLDKALDDLLAKEKIPYVVNAAAFAAANMDKDAISKTEIAPFGKMEHVSRATILKRLLEAIPNDGGKARPTYLLRPDHLEITTMDAKTIEARGVRTPPEDDIAAAMIPLPPLAYAAFEDVPLQEALKTLARTTESTIVVDPRAADAKTKVTAELDGVPLDAAVQLLADMANLKLVRIANAYYVTSPQNANRLQKEEDRRRQAPSEAPPVPPSASPGTPLPQMPPAEGAVRRAGAN